MALPDQQRISDHLVRLVQVFFAFVLAQGLFFYRLTLLGFFRYENWIAALALCCVFYTTVASWVDWHVTMERRPYDTRQPNERYRVYLDVFISALYAYLLFTVEPLVGRPSNSLTPHLAGYAVVFGLYIASGLLRRWAHGRSASKLKPLVIWFVAYVALDVTYFVVRRSVPSSRYVMTNATALAFAFVLMHGYRAYRRYLVDVDERAAARLTIGIDVDGVLANQIEGVLPILKQQYDVALRYEDVTDWRLAIKSSDIATEIVAAQRDRDYVLKMRAHEGAARVLEFLHQYHRLVIITARQGDAATTWTGEWLRRNKIPYDEVIASGEAKKSNHRADVLIDDYIGNIEEFLKNTTGVAVLIDQP